MSVYNVSDIVDVIKSNRPNLSPNSIKTYVSIIRNLKEKYNIDNNKYFSTHYQNVIDHLKDIASNKRKTLLSACLVFIENEKNDKATKAYRELMMNDSEVAKTDTMKNEKTDKQKENWISFNEIQNIYKKLEKSVNHLWNLENPSIDELQRLQQFVILACVSGIHIPPRRLLDWTNFRINPKTIDEKKDNYIDKNELVFTTFKTSKFYGEQRVEIPSKLKSILNKWIKMNPTDYLFFDNLKKPLNQSQLNQRIGKIFDKKISTNMLRHIFISDEVLKDMPKLQHMQKIASSMGNSISEQLQYMKK